MWEGITDIGKCVRVDFHQITKITKIIISNQKCFTSPQVSVFEADLAKVGRLYWVSMGEKIGPYTWRCRGDDF